VSVGGGCIQLGIMVFILAVLEPLESAATVLATEQVGLSGLACMWEVPGSNLCRGTDKPDREEFCCSVLLPASCWFLAWLTLRP
jgi:hypothetical protein